MAALITVIGDLMLDVSEEGSVHRVSPEAPVLILHNPVASHALGGAANTAANAKALGADVRLVGAVGPDDAAEQSRVLAVAAGIDGRFIEVDGYRTTIKRRFLSGGQQILRVDVEDGFVPASARTLLRAAAVEAVAGRAVVLSDYDKGLIDDEFAVAVIAASVAAGAKVVIDTKRLDLACFRGSTVLAPNHHEAGRITGETDPLAAAQAIASMTGGSAVLVTLGADGMLLLEDGVATHIASDAKEVADVTGAGDTVTAGLAVALAEGASLLSAARWANAAAAEAVSHHGTFAVPRNAVGEPES
jgi:D-beta-D-heptose 7-phosphate kinase/D-beta-D-heptose 1-phosphate adenosyltransferase